jgi:squalene-hopene/tetraprenyl-beta-curcumene cyclase
MPNAKPHTVHQAGTAIRRLSTHPLAALLALWLACGATDGATPAATRPAESATATAPGASGASIPAPLRNQVAAAIQRSLKRLESTQHPDGGWPGFDENSDPAVSSLIAKAFAQDPRYGPKHPVVRKALRFILAAKQPDGGIYAVPLVKNYSASVALMFLSSLDDPALRDEIRAQQTFLTSRQWHEGKTDNDGRPIDPKHPWYGGAGYGRHQRPDLSNTQMMLEALHQSGLPATDPVFQRAVVFISRCQMCGDTNDMPFAKFARDGGFIYTDANGGESKAGTETVDGHELLRSYGSMTYAGFKSLLYANVDRNDHRVQLAYRWIRSNYTLDANPNMPGQHSKEGLYYYYHVFAKALAAWGQPTIEMLDGTKRNWRLDLCNKLLAAQQPDGSWVNTADRWMEGNPDLVSAYAILALQQALNDAPPGPHARQ